MPIYGLVFFDSISSMPLNRILHKDNLLIGAMVFKNKVHFPLNSVRLLLI